MAKENKLINLVNDETTVTSQLMKSTTQHRIYN